MSSHARCMPVREHQRFRMNDAKRLDCVMREARCMADETTFREKAAQAVQTEIVRLRHLGATPATIAAFQAAAEVHVALCGTVELHKDADGAEQPFNNPGRKNR
ncbi:MAG TPA: hypothetical protein VH704_03005 [Casimicrobiaceae bacterium]|nr:hypothetical protein [Casimicrobiaceae bacterium]